MAGLRLESSRNSSASRKAAHDQPRPRAPRRPKAIQEVTPTLAVNEPDLALKLDCPKLARRDIGAPLDLLRRWTGFDQSQPRARYVKENPFKHIKNPKFPQRVSCPIPPEDI